jgi:hypothetical protein
MSNKPEGFIMFTLFPNRSTWLVAALLCCFIATNTALAKGKGDKQHTKTVDCYKSHTSVQSAIDKVKVGRDTTIFIVGFCDEQVSIVKDGITLSGNKDGADIIGGGLTEVVVTGAQRVNIEYLELTGDGSGVGVGEGASVTIRNSNIHDNEADGVGVYYNAFARLESNMITGNGQQEDEEAGIQVYQGGIVRSSGNNIADNGYAAIEVGSVSYFRSFGGDILRQTGCDEDEAPGDGSSCGKERTVALDCYRSATCEFRDTQVTGNIDISSLSNFDARNSTVNGLIFGSGGSRVHVRGSVAGFFSVICFDPVIAQGAVQCGGSFPP